MSFDRTTRNQLARMVGQARECLKADVIDQLRRLGLQADGTMLPLDRIAGHSDADRAAGVELRAQLEHFAAAESGPETDRRRASFDRLAREIGFTTLNRLVALRMAEERGLIVESVGRGFASAGFQIYDRVANGALGNRAETYRAYVECLYDELAVDLPLLFDRATPDSRIFPGERCLEEVLDLLNDAGLAHIWREDEAIGWVYQYYNDPAERKQMRESQAPRNSRELAVRNQFFTPRYVVEFLTDNTLGRTWYEMRQGDSRLKDECRYLVRRPNEVFLAEGEAPPPDAEPAEDLSQEELLWQPVYIPHRSKKDPQDIKILDPACGSGHFLLYAFDLLETIYEEAWEDERSPKSEVTAAILRDDYPDLDALRRAMPGLILRHNLHGIDIDPRAIQIAGLALWLRAQRSYQRLNLRPAERPPITKSKLVTAEPMPGEQAILDEFLTTIDRRLRPLVRTVWKKMQLAGEAGSLLKIEEEIAEALDKARHEALVDLPPVKLSLFEPNQPPQQMVLTFATADEQAFWADAEKKLLDALHDYAARTTNGAATQRRLFAEDAAQGFAFVDLCQKRFVVVLMNPPFGAPTGSSKTYIERAYPRTKNDVYAAFTERFLEKLHSDGKLGAITSRVGFFSSSFTRWREEVVQKEATLDCLADLGIGVMDDAMVEAAAYCFDRKTASRSAVVVRLLGNEERESALRQAVICLANGAPNSGALFTTRDELQVLPGSPFVYWVDKAVLSRFAALPGLEPAVASVRQGLSTGDNERFVRTTWEVPPEHFRGSSHLPGGSTQKLHTTWAFLVMTGASQPWYSPTVVVVNWKDEGSEMRESVNKQGKPGAVLRNTSFYFRPGFSWTRRAVRFIPYAIPAGCIPSASRYMAFPQEGREFEVIAVTASNVASAYLRFYGEMFERPNYLVENVKSVPYASLPDNLVGQLEQLARSEVACRRRAYQNHEPFHEFTVPTACFPNPLPDALSFDRRSLLGYELDQMVAAAYGIGPSDFLALQRDLWEAIDAQYGRPTPEVKEGSDDEGARDFTLATGIRSEREALLSYSLGCAFGRWDVRIGCNPTFAPSLADPFDPLPVCPPGMLVGPDGLPARSGAIVSEEWLRARRNAITLPPDGAVARPTISDDEYPIRIRWDGILVNDPEHENDMVRRVGEVLAVLWPENAEDIKQEACEILGVRDLRDYFGKPGNFFADHLARYSKSRRQAPIYWPLSTASGSYTLWLYYHRLTSDTLYMAVNRYVEPKLTAVQRGLSELGKELGKVTGQKATKLREKVDEMRTFLRELTEFRDELLRVAAFYRPDLNDGVIISAAPLHKLYRLSKWAKATAECWQKLERGDYDWAHLAYTIWPERVTEKCRLDRSLAIAHDLEELYVAPPETEKKRRGRRKELPLRSDNEEGQA